MSTCLVTIIMACKETGLRYRLANLHNHLVSQDAYSRHLNQGNLVATPTHGKTHLF